MPAAAAAATWYVAGTGRDSNAGTSIKAPFATLQHAAGKTSPGDTVMVLNGTYVVPCSGCDVLDITTSGTAVAPITYQAYPGQSPVIDFKNGWTGISIQANHITVSGFNVGGGRALVSLAYAQKNATNLSNYLTSGNGIVVGCSGGAKPPTFSHVIIRNNVVHDAPGAGIATCYADYITIQHNTTYLNAFWSPYANSGISIWEMRDTDRNTGYKNFILGNLSYDNRNYIPFYAVGAITDGNGIIVDDNKNTQSDNVAYGGRTLVANNISYMNGGSGIHAYASAHVDIVFNTTYENNRTPSLNEGQIFANTGTDVTILNNILYAAPNDTYYSNYNNGANVVYDYNLLYSTTPKAGEKGLAPGPHDIVADPLFTSASGFMFTLLSGSPAIGRASSTDAPATDYAGNPRPTPGGGYDRGALQWQKNGRYVSSLRNDPRFFAHVGRVWMGVGRAAH
jgi:hypothetical protein